MHEINFFLSFVQRLNQAKLRYLVTGSVAAMLYGEPRLTQDVDLVLEVSAQEIAKLPGLFPAPDFYCPPLEVLLIENNRRQRGHFNLIEVNTGHKADIYLHGEDPLHTWAFLHAKEVKFQGEPIKVAAPEYVIIRKLQYYLEGESEKHLRDIQTMLQVSKHYIDLAELEARIQYWGLTKAWSKVSTGK
jgi:hypothetical protein